MYNVKGAEIQKVLNEQTNTNFQNTSISSLLKCFERKSISYFKPKTNTNFDEIPVYITKI